MGCVLYAGKYGISPGMNGFSNQHIDMSVEHEICPQTTV